MPTVTSGATLVLSNGLLFTCGDYNSQCFASVADTGNVSWSIATQYIVGSPAQADDGSVLLLTYEALDRVSSTDGSTLAATTWSGVRDEYGVYGPMIGGANTVYISTRDYNLESSCVYAFTGVGLRQAWRSCAGPAYFGCTDMALSSAEELFMACRHVSTREIHVLAFDGGDAGVMLWDTALPSFDAPLDPIVDAIGNVHVFTTGSLGFCLSGATGGFVWNYTAPDGSSFASPPAMASDGSILIHYYYNNTQRGLAVYAGVSSSSPSVTGAIVGGVMGALAAIVVLIAALVVLHRMAVIRLPFLPAPPAHSSRLPSMPWTTSNQLEAKRLLTAA